MNSELSKLYFELKNIDERLVELEEDAGISEQMEFADGPVDFYCVNEPNDEYSARECDHAHRHTRNAYFSVQNLDKRKTLIATKRERQRIGLLCINEQIRLARNAVITANSKLDNQSWTLAAFISMGVVVIGYLIFNLVGAIAGLVGGFFIGKGVLADLKSRAQADFDKAKDSEDFLLKEIENDSCHPDEIFSYAEELSGERNLDMDRNSALANLFEKRKKEK